MKVDNEDLMELGLNEIHTLTDKNHIVLYHLSHDTYIDCSLPKTFTPSTPVVNFPLLGEDDTTPRISFSSTYQGCLNGVNPSSNTDTFALYPVVIRRDDPFLITPDILYNEGKVPDALYIKEYWYTAPLTLYPILVQLSDIERVKVNDNFLAPSKEIVNWLLEESSNDSGINILPELINKLNNVYDLSETHSEDTLNVILNFNIEEITEY